MAEVVYAPALFAPLIATIDALHSPATRILLGYEIRHNSDSGFFSLLHSRYNLEPVPAEHYTVAGGIPPRPDLDIYILTRKGDAAAALESHSFPSSSSPSSAGDKLLFWFSSSAGRPAFAAPRPQHAPPRPERNLTTEKGDRAVLPAASALNFASAESAAWAPVLFWFAAGPRPADMTASLPPSRRAKQKAPPAGEEGSASGHQTKSEKRLPGLITKAPQGSVTPGVEYGTTEYWDERYRAADEANQFDWYQRWSTLEPALRPHLRTTDRILMVGCGDAAISGDMYAAGFRRIENFDISEVCIEKMAKKHPEMTWRVLDCASLPYNCEFDAAIDKGTLDAILCGKDSRRVSYAMMHGIFRALKPGGRFIEVSHASPEWRLSTLTAGGAIKWDVQTQQLLKPEATASVPEYHYVYVLTKQ